MFNPTLPLAQAHTIPSEWYFTQEFAALERQTVFAGWRIAGRVDQVQKPGDYLTAEIAGEPILVVRGADNVLRAFHNVCRHRAAPVMTEPCGHATKLRCIYHGWTYDLEGKLRGTPEFENVCDFPKEDNGLTPLTVEVWGPSVWVHDSTPTMPLSALLSPMPEKTADSGINKLVWAGRKEYELNCNWKVYVDNYLDGGYHVNTIHPGLAEVLDYHNYRTHVFDWCSVQSSPTKAAAGAESAVRTGEAQYWWVFPNFMLNSYSGVMDTNLVLPLAPDRCLVIFDFYFGADVDKEFTANSIAVADKIQDEDVGICESVQRGLKSRSYSTGRFSVRREAGGYHFHQLLAKVMGRS